MSKYEQYDQQIIDMKRGGVPNRDIAMQLCPENFVGMEVYISRNKQRLRDMAQYRTEKITTDKKEGELHWREWIKPVQEMQALASKASGSQDRAMWKIDTDQPICVLVLGDTQLGSWATDYDLFVRITDEIINIPNLYVVLVGDLNQMAIKLRGVLEVNDNVIPPRFQHRFLSSWLSDIQHKVICSTWDNHSVMREEDQAGFSAYAEIFKRATIYFNGIGHIDIQVGEIVYKWAVSHFFRGKSLLNKTHAPARYLRHEAPDRDIAAQGDFHDPGFAKYTEGGKEKLAIVCGSIQTNSGYAKRFYSLTTCPTMPCVELHPTEKIFTPYWSVADWMASKGIKYDK